MKKGKIFIAILALCMALALTAGCGNQTGGENESSNATPSQTDELGYEEGTSPADDIVNTSAADKALLVVSFGTSYNQSRALTIGGIEKALAEAYPDYQVRRAFTAQIVIDKLKERDNLTVDNVDEAMNRLVLDKVKEVVIQPTMVMSGYEYDDVIAAVMPFADKFESFKIGKPLLSDDGDYAAVADIIAKITEEYRGDDTAIVFMGHGTEHSANAAYAKLQQTLADKGLDDCIIGTVEAEPTLDDVRDRLKTLDAKKVVLRDLMVVAGDHANNDMAGDDPDSWKSILTADGYAVETVLEGLGQLPEIQRLYVEHAENAEIKKN
jgi:sirohydrochlorin cobaltochelatase